MSENNEIKEPLLIAVREEAGCPFRDVRDGFCCLELCNCMTLKSKDCPLKNSDHVYVRLVDTIACS